MTAILMLGALGCEHGVDGSGTVRVPPEVQQLFSAEKPGQVAVRVDWPAGRRPGSTLAVGYLCAPGTALTTFRFTSFDFDCAQKADIAVHAWAAPASQPIPPGRCGQLEFTGVLEPPTEAKDAVASAKDQTSVEVSDSLGNCNDGSFHFDLTLEPGSPGS